MFFIKQFLKSPLTIGSVCPSSQALSRALGEMAVEMYRNRRGLIVDLGAGTGVVTRELLDLGVNPEEILAIDISENFRPIFNSQCMPISLHIGDARNLHEIITADYPDLPVIAIISSLPLKSMFDKDIAAIMPEIWRILYERGGILLQYTYALWSHSSLTQYGFSLAGCRYIMRNFPPTLIEKYLIKI